jgi:hypothetical protein
MMSNQVPLSARAQEMFPLIKKYLASGLSRRAFCEQEKLTFPTFHYWRRKYATHQREKETPAGSHAEFIPLRVVPKTSTPWIIEYPNGVILRLPATVDIEVVAQLIQVIDHFGWRQHESRERS